MSSVNKVILVGRLGKDPEVRALDSGVKVASFSLATSESYRDKNTGEKVENTEWHNVVLWRGIAEVAEKYLQKGSLVYIEGSLKTEQYDKDGETRYSTKVVGQKLTMLGGKSEGSQERPSAPAPSAAPLVDDDQDLPF
tara:strand:+ start:632 stop:1045 length:414 start_codon:yes stop_codon:yes gene_type:complete